MELAIERATNYIVNECSSLARDEDLSMEDSLSDCPSDSSDSTLPSNCSANDLNEAIESSLQLHGLVTKDIVKGWKMELDRKEEGLTRRELELQRCKELLRQEVKNLLTDNAGRVPSGTTELIKTTDQKLLWVFNIADIAKLLCNFDGITSSFESWEKRVKLLKTMYKLDEEATKVLIATRLTGKALEWFYSKPELIELNTEGLLNELRAMFNLSANEIVRRRRFENRIWKHRELFKDYYYDKITLANCVPIREDEVLAHIVDGIPDVTLRILAKTAQSKESLLQSLGHRMM